MKPYATLKWAIISLLIPLVVAPLAVIAYQTLSNPGGGKPYAGGKNHYHVVREYLLLEHHAG